MWFEQLLYLTKICQYYLCLCKILSCWCWSNIVSLIFTLLIIEPPPPKKKKKNNIKQNKKSICVCETQTMPPAATKSKKAIFRAKVKVKVTRSLTLVSFERASLVEYACQIRGLEFFIKLTCQGQVKTENSLAHPNNYFPDKIWKKINSEHLIPCLPNMKVVLIIFARA